MGVLANSSKSSQVGSRPSSGSSLHANKTSLLPNPTTTPILARAWSGHDINFTMANGVMYVGTVDNAVYALHMSDGTVLWHQKIDGSVSQQLFLLNGVVYVATPEGIVALLSSSGSVLWHFVTPGTGANWPLVANGIVYITSSLNRGPGTLYALRASDGMLLWHYRAGSSISSPFVSNGIVYINSDGGILAALRASDGHRLWQRAIDASFFQSMQLVDGVLYTAAAKMSEPTAALSPKHLQGVMAIGSLLWNTLQTVPIKPTIPAKEALSTVYAIRASDGTILWRYPLSNGKNSWADWLTVEQGVVYAGATAVMNDTTNNGVIYLSTSNSAGTSTLYALQARDGSMLWNYPVAGGASLNAPVLDGTTLYTGATNGMIYALHASSGAIQWHYQTDVGS